MLALAPAMVALDETSDGRVARPNGAPDEKWALRGGGRPLFVGDHADSIGRVDVNDPGPVCRRLLLGHPRVAGQDHEVSRPDEVGGRTVDADLSRAASSRDDVGREASAVGHVVNIDLLVLEKPSRLDESRIDRDRAHIVDIGASHRRTVNFSEQELANHLTSGRGRTRWLSPPGSQNEASRAPGQCGRAVAAGTRGVAPMGREPPGSPGPPGSERSGGARASRSRQFSASTEPRTPGSRAVEE